MIEKRQYVRMSTVFPVELEIFRQNWEKGSAKLFQGFTRDVSAGGMCIELKSFGKQTEELISSPNVHLSLRINPPFSSEPIKAFANIVWLKKETTDDFSRFLIGVHYSDINERSRQRLVAYAQKLQWMPRLAGIVGVVLIAALAVFYAYAQHVTGENKKLIEQLSNGAAEKSKVSAQIIELEKKKAQLDKVLTDAKSKMAVLEKSITDLTDVNAEQKAIFEKELISKGEQEKVLTQQIQTLAIGANKLQTQYKSLEKKEAPVVAEIKDQMIEWLKSHQNIRTGLIGSFEGDESLGDMAFTYDQSLTIQALLLSDNKELAAQILSFFSSKAQRKDGAFFNAYDAATGDVTESTIHAGPNLWIGIAALQYESRVKDGKFLNLARSIGEWALLQQDNEGGIPGGPGIKWYSTEHNLDAYAFFNMFYQITGDEKYKQASLKSLEWLQKYAFSVKEKRMNRGKGDSTIATDTFSWAIAAIGPSRLAQLDFDPVAIIDYAKEHCEVSVLFQRPSGEAAPVKGFDFAKSQNLGRGGVISTEWTAQMIVAYQVLSKYFESTDPAKAEAYRHQADFYLNELQKMIIASPSRIGRGRGCLPYASVDNADTGHGWRTPKGSRTGSVSGTAYGLFAWMNYNPFELKKGESQ